jgi:hypothetical protein
MIRRLRLPWPDEQLFDAREGRPIRLLAVSDQMDPAFSHERNRADLGPIDAILGCGDLEPDYLGFLADAFRVPLMYVRGNHDRGLGWAKAEELIPDPLPANAVAFDELPIVGLSWPGPTSGRAERDESRAWTQAIGSALRLLRRRRPVLVLSHVPPRGMGDADDVYHTGFRGYRWFAERVRPPVWLHGHTTYDPSRPWHETHGDTVFVNVTGAVLVELVAAGEERGVATAS